MKNWIQKVKKWVKSLRFSGSRSGQFGWYEEWGGYLPGSTYAYKQEAGPLWENGIVLACVNWLARAFCEVPLIIRKNHREGRVNKVTLHPALNLLEAPNAFYDGAILWSGTLLSLCVDGNAYWYKVRSSAGKVVELWYLPHSQIEPVWDRRGEAFISGYEYRVNGEIHTFSNEDVVHLRYGMLDPMNPRKGLSPLSAVLREVCVDNESATFGAALLRNMGIPGAIITPLKEEVPMNPDQYEQLLHVWRNKFRGEQRGEPLVVPIPIQVLNPGFSPEQMVLDKVRRIPEERITAALGVSSIVIGLGSGLDHSTYNNFKEAREATYESTIIPMQRILVSQLNRQLLCEFSDSGYERFEFDTSEVTSLREDLDRLHRRIVADYQGGVITRAEAREVLGWPARMADEMYFGEENEVRKESV